MLDIYPGMELLDHMADLFFVLCRTSILFSLVATHLHSYQHSTRVPFSPLPYQHLLFVVFLTVTFLTGVR